MCVTVLGTLPVTVSRCRSPETELGLGVCIGYVLLHNKVLRNAELTATTVHGRTRIPGSGIQEQPNGVVLAPSLLRSQSSCWWGL